MSECSIRIMAHFTKHKKLLKNTKVSVRSVTVWEHAGQAGPGASA